MGNVGDGSIDASSAERSYDLLEPLSWLSFIQGKRKSVGCDAPQTQRDVGEREIGGVGFPVAEWSGVRAGALRPNRHAFSF